MRSSDQHRIRRSAASLRRSMLDWAPASPPAVLFPIGHELDGFDRSGPTLQRLPIHHQTYSSQYLKQYVNRRSEPSTFGSRTLMEQYNLRVLTPAIL
jgi:hypothetical protein